LSAGNATLTDMLVYAFDLQIKQIAGEPAWADKDKFDIAAVAEGEGAASPAQMKLMCRKLLEDRFKLTFHHESRELPAYLLSVAKSGPKLPKNETGKPGPGAVRMMMSQPGMLMFAGQNATMAELAMVLQQVVLDRPVVDRTELGDRYDFKLTFAPSGTEFGGTMRLATGNGAAIHIMPTDDLLAPSLFAAVQALGLKLEGAKTAVDVLVVDRVEKPSEN
jgi:uncharacterized protein (TIGR03435 family)